MGTAGHRREDERSSAEMRRAEGLKLKLKQTQRGPRGAGGGAAGPRGQSHQLHLGPRVLLDHCFFHGYRILAFVLMDYITGWRINQCPGTGVKARDSWQTSQQPAGAAVGLEDQADPSQMVREREEEEEEEEERDAQKLKDIKNCAAVKRYNDIGADKRSPLHAHGTPHASRKCPGKISDKVSAPGDSRLLRINKRKKRTKRTKRRGLPRSSGSRC
ncbi:hypothetical protein EYF80_011087 [Liparis tanakae]|uniref:Uncharacterized protein n=1 Tax=Liparis tanakae TaxID=230148 RepID=A0A4Z2INE8_9TELE|nr:hypothetical protein EYF80_011087 [Liparis tanakae]